MEIFRPYGTASCVIFPLVVTGSMDFTQAAAHASGDTKLVTDAGSGNTDYAFAHVGAGIYQLALAASELNHPRLAITVIDQTSPKVWADQAIIVTTYGNASAEHAFDLGTATQTVALAGSALGASSIAANAIGAATIAASALTSAKFADSAITAGVIAADAIGSSELATGAITADTIAANAITSSELATGAITADVIAASAITNAEVADGAITAGTLAGDTITAGTIAASALTSSEIADGAVTGVTLGASAITVSQMADSAITSGVLAASALTASEFATGALDTIADAVLDEVVENSKTLRQFLRVIKAALAGKSSGGGTASITFRNDADDGDRIVATVDSDGNRSAVSLTVG